MANKATGAVPLIPPDYRGDHLPPRDELPPTARESRKRKAEEEDEAELYTEFFQKAVEDLYRNRPPEYQVDAFRAYEIFRKPFRESFGGEAVFPEELAIGILGAANRERSKLLVEGPPAVQIEIPDLEYLDDAGRDLVDKAIFYEGPIMALDRGRLALAGSFANYIRDTTGCEPELYFLAFMKVYTLKRENELLSLLSIYPGELLDASQRPHRDLFNFINAHIDSQLYPTISPDSILHAIRTAKDLEVMRFVFSYPEPFVIHRAGEALVDPKMVESLKTHLLAKKFPLDDLAEAITKAYRERGKVLIEKAVSDYLEPYLSGKYTRANEPTPRPILLDQLYALYREKVGDIDKDTQLAPIAQSAYFLTVASHFASQVGKTFYNELYQSTKSPTYDPTTWVKETAIPLREKVLRFYGDLKNSEEFSPLFNRIIDALQEALPKDFPGLTSNREAIETQFTEHLYNVVFPAYWES